MDTFHEATLCSALGAYYAQRGRPATASDYFYEVADDDILAPTAWNAILEIQALGDLILVGTAQEQLKEFRQAGTDEHAVILPGNRDGRLAEAERDLKRCEQALHRILPKHQLWRYGWRD